MTDIAASHLNTAKSLAHQMRIPTDSIDFDDFVQEGAVAAWLATKDKDLEAPVTYGMVAAKRRIIGTLRGKHPMYGSEAEPGKRIHDQFRSKANDRDNYEDLMDTAYRGDVFVAVERRVDVERALAGLSARDLEIVRLRGEEATWDEIAAAVGMTKAGCFNRWRNILRPDLGNRLSAVS
jgi:RNA polymerase sigma factor (sigma-70 family)